MIQDPDPFFIFSPNCQEPTGFSDDGCHHCNDTAVIWYISPSTGWIHARCKKHVMETWKGLALDNDMKVVFTVLNG